MKPFLKIAPLAVALLLPATAALASPSAAQKWFQRVDRNNNGTIELAEYRKHRNNNFNSMDKNKDKKLTLKEFMGQLNNAKGNHAKSLKMQRAKYFAALDGNNDKLVGPLEWSADTERKFKRTDTNHNGKITKQEIEKAFKGKVSLD